MSALSEEEELASLFMAGCNGGCAENELPMDEVPTNCETVRRKSYFKSNLKITIHRFSK